MTAMRLLSALSIVGMGWVFGTAWGSDPVEKGDGKLTPQVIYAPSSGAQMLAQQSTRPDEQPVQFPYLEPPAPGEVPAGPEGLIQRPVPSPVRMDAIAIAPVPSPGSEPLAPPLTVSFAGTLDNGTSIPPDTMGAVGPNHVVNFLNTGFQVFDRTGVVVMPQISLSTFWSALGVAASGPYDPKILFDQYVNRWVVVTDARSNSVNSNVLVGISDSDDPTGTWKLFSIKADPASSSWADYPGLGIDGANVYVTNNMFTIGASPGFVTAKFWVISKASMIAGGPLNMRTDTPVVVPGFTYQPCHSFDPSPGGLNYLVNQGWAVTGTPRRFILLNQYVGVGAAAVLTEIGFVEVGGYTFSTLTAPQKDCGTDIATNDPRIINAVLRNGKVWTTHSVGVGATISPAPASRSEIAWHELNPAVANVPGPYAFANQDGRVGHATLAYYFPSIAVNANECVALGFSGSDASTYASAYYTVRTPLEPPGTMEPVSTLNAGTASYWKQFGGTRNRWGDYSATVVDPVDDQTFWTTQEYATTPFSGGPICALDGGRWGLWWGSFQCLIGKTPKFSQPPDNTGQVIASDLDTTDLNPNVVLADDFVSDGRPITGVRWWGGDLALPLPDGWFISFHEPLTTGGSPASPLGLYFCDTTVVTKTPTALLSCDAVPVFEYEVQIEDCCMIHSNMDSRNSLFPAQPTGFYEEVCFAYDLDVQAVVGNTYSGPGCAAVATGNSAAAPFWGWHSTGVESGTRQALESSVSMAGPNWLYGPWSLLAPSCGAPNMAFELLTNQFPNQPDCNHNDVPDVCESLPDCQPNGVPDECDLVASTSADCNHNTVPDECDIASAFSLDCQPNGIPDECDLIFVGWLTSARPGVLGFTDISGTGTPLNLTDDGSADVTIPFAAAAFGGPTVSVSNNGGIGTTPGAQLGPVPNAPLPSTDAFGGGEGLLAYWDDLHETTGNVYYQTVGATPSQTFIVQWDDREHFDLADGTLDGDEVTFQIQIFESPVSGIVAQYLYADTNFLNASYNNGRSATVGYQRNSTSAIQWSFNTAGAVSPGVVVSLLKGDVNGNSLPDGCEPAGDAAWNASDSSPDRTTRSLRFTVVPVGGSTLLENAIKVTMVDLQHPNPRNLPQYPPPSYSTFDTGTHGTCAGATTSPNFNGHHCSDDAECLGPNNAITTDDGTCSLPGPACTAAGETNGCARWVGRPWTFYEAQGPPQAGPYRAARLQCTPSYWDWITETSGGPITVVGAEILPSSEYSVQVYGTSCKGAETGCTNVSAAVPMFTRRKGDLDDVYQLPSPIGLSQPNAIDVAQSVAAVKHLLGAPIHGRAQMQPNLPELNTDANVLDVVEVVDGLKGLAYPFPGPCACPSTVTCGGTCTGCAGLCLKTCVGGANDGETCINNTHCPGGGVCGTPGLCNGGSRDGLTCGSPANCPNGGCNVGYCRDKCGRCN